MGCTALRELDLSDNQVDIVQLWRELEGLEYRPASLTPQPDLLTPNPNPNALQLTGGLEPLSCCTALRQLYLSLNQLTGIYTRIRPLYPPPPGPSPPRSPPPAAHLHPNLHRQLQPASSLERPTGI
jgi:hypothetical protein